MTKVLMNDEGVDEQTKVLMNEVAYERGVLDKEGVTEVQKWCGEKE